MWWQQNASTNVWNSLLFTNLNHDSKTASNNTVKTLRTIGKGDAKIALTKFQNLNLFFILYNKNSDILKTSKHYKYDSYKMPLKLKFFKLPFLHHSLENHLIKSILNDHSTGILNACLLIVLIVKHSLSKTWKNGKRQLINYRQLNLNWAIS